MTSIRFPFSVSRFLFFLTALAAVQFAAASCNSGSYTTGGIANVLTIIECNTGGVLPVVALISVFVIAGFYALGTAWSKPEWILLAKDEMYHLFFSLILLVGVFGIITFSGMLTGAVFDSAKNSLNLNDPCSTAVIPIPSAATQQISTCYMKMMSSSAELIIAQDTQKQIDYLLDASQYISYYGLIQGTTFSPYAYKRTWSMTVDNINNLFILPAYMSIKAQQIFVQFFLGDPSTGASGSSIFTLILPGAFLLRFAPGFRNTGNLLIAIALGLYTLVPFMIALNGMMYSAVLTNCNDYLSVINDAVLGDCSATGNFFQIASIYPQAFLLPNMIISIFVTYAMAMNKALRMIG